MGNLISEHRKRLFFFGFFFLTVLAKSQGDFSNEAFKFDAIGTDNLVDLPTGDFNYQTPVLYIPGPEGGYDVNLTYNAGIKMSQDASWLGLGWNFSPGAIVRTVNGTPDDIKEYEVYNLNRNYGSSNFTDVHIFTFLDFIQIPWTASGSRRKVDWNNFSFQTGYNSNSVDQFNARNAIVTLGLGAAEGLNRMKNGYSRSVGAGDNGGNVGHLISKTLNNVQLSHSGGMLSFSNDGGGQNTFFYDIGHYSTLNWEVYSNYSKFTAGSLYLGNGFEADAGELWRQSYNRSMDIYVNQTSTYNNSFGNNNLTFPAYDEYSVSAAGLSGSLTPITLKDGALVGDGETVDDTYNQYLIDYTANDLYTENAAFNGANQNKVSFVFRGQHASVSNKPGTFNISGNNVTTTSGSLQGTQLNGRVLGGKNIKTHTGSEGDITGFSITNEDGITYNFTFPVYQYEKIQTSQDSKYVNGVNIRVFPKKYAYAWLLQSITGTDYVDKVGSQSGPDKEDSGYWVKFNYGKWTDGYVWSDPYDVPEAKLKYDEDKTVTSQQMGVKELAYLNSIETRSHIAYFVKFMREDGLGSTAEFDKTLTIAQEKVIAGNESFYGYKLVKTSTDDLNWAPANNGCYTSEVHDKLDSYGNEMKDENNVTIREKTWTEYVPTYFNIGDKFNADGGSYTSIKLDNIMTNTSATANDIKQRVLGLKKIILVPQNEVLSSTQIEYSSAITGNVNMSTASTIYNPKVNGYNIYTSSPCDGSAIIKSSLQGLPTYSSGNRVKYYGGSVIDIADLANSTIESKALQIVQFNYDYSLCKNSPNSLPITGGSGNNGKLTLKSIDIMDNESQNFAPSISFKYDLNPDYEHVNVGTTADPKYVKMQDDWGYRLSTNTDLHNVVNKDELEKDLSSAWSLTEIETSLGGKIKVNYESDVYVKEASTLRSFMSEIKDVKTDIASVTDRILFTADLPIDPLNSELILNEEYSVLLDDLANNTSVTVIAKPIGFYTFDNKVKFEIVSGWDGTFNMGSWNSYNKVYFSNGSILNFSPISIFSVNDNLKVEFNPSVNLSQSFYVGKAYDLVLNGSNLTSLNTVPARIQDGSLTLQSAIVQSVNTTNHEIVFSLSDEINTILTDLTPSKYSYSSGERKPMNGGGLRVKDIIKTDENDNEYKTTFEYKYGVTSFAPGDLKSKRIKYIAELPAPQVIYGTVIQKNVGSNNEVNEITEYQFETMNSCSDGPELSYGDQLYIENGQVLNSSYINGTNHSYFHTRVGTIHNNTGRIGRLKSIVNKNAAGLSLGSVTYVYYDKELALSGITQESFHDRKRHTVAVWPNYYSDLYYTYSSRIFYPNELAGVISEKNGISTRIRYGNYSWGNDNVEQGGFDKYTHQPLIIAEKKALGEYNKLVSIPAYTIYPSLSLKDVNSGYKNILSPVAKSYNYIVNELGEEKLISANVQTFKNDWYCREYSSSSSSYSTVNKTNIWRKDKSYSWQNLLNDLNNEDSGDGTLKDFTEYDWESSTNENWKNFSSVSLINDFSKPLEVKDINNVYSLTKMGYKNTYPIASVTNSKYSASAYSGAEDVSSDINFFGGEVSGASKQFFSKAFAHTGDYSVKVESNETGFSYGGTVGNSSNFDYQKNQSIKASVWVHKLNSNGAKLKYELTNSAGVVSSGFVDIASGNTMLFGNKWYLLTLEFLIPANTTATSLVVSTTNTGSLPVYFDDFRIHPKDAIMNATVYDNIYGWKTATLNSDNIGTRYFYNNSGKIIRTDVETVEGWKKLSENEYNYGRP